MKLEGKVAAVTGGSAGIGRGIVEYGCDISEVAGGALGATLPQVDINEINDHENWTCPFK